MAEEVDESVLNTNLKSYNTYMTEINQQLSDIDKTLNKEYYQSQRPTSIINRVFVDLFGVVGLYLMLFVLCDFTRVVIKGDSFFGLKWLFWGPYYYITDAPLLTRIWESKKFLKDLSEVRNDADFVWPDEKSCTQIGNAYAQDCQHEKNSGKKHPIKDKVGDGLDWLIRHTVGQSFGGVLGNGDCTDQGSTIAKDCAYDRCLAIWKAYNLFCDQYDVIINRATDMNWPNERPWTGNMLNNAPFSSWNDHEKAAYQCYYDSYIKIYQIGSTAVGDDGVPHDLMPDYDHDNYYSFNAAVLFHSSRIELYNPIYLNTFFGAPVWWTNGTNPIPESDMESFIRYFQLHIAEHTFDYWDTM